MSPSFNNHLHFPKSTLGAIILLVASGSTFLLIGFPQVAWKFSTEAEGKPISSVSGGFGFSGNPSPPNLSDPANVGPTDAGWKSFRVKWTILSLPGPIMIGCLILCGVLLLLAGCGAMTTNLNHKRLLIRASSIATILLFMMTVLLILGDGNDPQKLGPSLFGKAEERVHVDDPYEGNGNGYDIVFSTEPGLGFFILVLTSLNAFLGTLLFWQNNSFSSFFQSSET
jgi:hypothetical protein